MKRVAVLGARGFLGSYICHNLRNHIILPVTRQTLDLTDYDQVSDWLDQARPDTIINCATAGGKTKLGDHNYSDLQNNVQLFLNFYNLSDKFHRFINIGSGAEFDRSLDIFQVQENDICRSNPSDSYGLSKNIIARLCLEKPNFCTLRLFGIFDSTEPDIRILKKCQIQQEITVNDCEFDMISARDFLRILDYYISVNEITYQDINCVYSDKTTLESIVRHFASIHNANLRISINRSATPKNYSGSGQRLANLGLDLWGLNTGLEHYA